MCSSDLSKEERERVLRQRMKAITEQLGEADDENELTAYLERIDGTKLSEEARKAAIKQVRKMRFPMTMGLDVPGPGSSRFQTMFSSALQVIGGVEASRTPLPPGPRDCVPSGAPGAGAALGRVPSYVAGVVAELGGSPSRLASLARERGVPAVLGVAEATRRIPDGAQVAVDGVGGVVRWVS